MTRRTHHTKIILKMFPVGATGKYQIRWRSEHSKEWVNHKAPMKKGTAMMLLSKLPYTYGGELGDLLSRKFYLWEYAS